MKKRFGWFTGGGFEKDPLLTEADKRYYRKELAKETERADKSWYKEEKERKAGKDDWL